MKLDFNMLKQTLDESSETQNNMIIDENISPTLDITQQKYNSFGTSIEYYFRVFLKTSESDYTYKNKLNEKEIFLLINKEVAKNRSGKIFNYLDDK